MKKILVIEDDQWIALGLAVRLKRAGYATWVAGDGLMAVNMAVRNKPHLILLDISLPAGNGLELARTFRRIPETRDTPFVFVTASQDPELDSQAAALGAAGLIRKPYDGEELLLIAQRVLGDTQPAMSAGTALSSGLEHDARLEPITHSILIIEDTPPVAAALEIRLRASGYDTWIAGDAIMGWSLAVRNRPDLILLDIAIPGGDGFALAKRFQETPETRTIPIIFLTASKDPKLRQKAMRLKAAGLLEKPYDAGELLAITKLVFGRAASARLDPALAPPRAATSSLAPPGSKHILIIEDDRKIALGLALRLRAAGYETGVAYDALSGVRSAVNHHPDLVLLDISMPAGDGFVVAERIRKRLPASTPIIFLTASQRPEFRRRAKELGAAGFFMKPFASDELLAAVHQALPTPPTE